ncbi:MAG: hypothetical protein ACXWJ0_14260 [Xanthobacteraceae bacterium]
MDGVASLAVSMVFSQKLQLQGAIAARAIGSNNLQNAAFVAQTLVAGSSNTSIANLKAGIGQLLNMEA